MAKLCPLKAKTSEYGNITFQNCEGSKCGWWNKYVDECGITSIGCQIMKLQTKDNNKITIEEL